MAKDFLTINTRAAQNLATRSSARPVLAATTKVVMHARLLAPGSMKEKIRPIVTSRGPGALGIVMCDHPAASFVLHGTPPHVIVAKRGRFLKFEIDGEIIFRNKVNHPGFKGNNFLWKAVQASRIA
jgi:hypothetical protein